MKESISFYTEILDFKLKYPGSSSEDWVIDLINGEAEIQLSTMHEYYSGVDVDGRPIHS